MARAHQAPLNSLPALWLRDNCPCADCRDPHNGQKLFQITDLPADLSVASERPVMLDGVPAREVRWQPDGHLSHYPQSWLDMYADGNRDYGDSHGRTEAAKRLWTAADFTEGLPEAEWDAYRKDPAETARILDAVAELGFALLRSVPSRDGQVMRVAETFGFVRETNYGRMFEVRVEKSPTNLAFTSSAITPHTDNPYRDPVPTLQLLHCLDNSAQGGDSGLVDGFMAAAVLRTEHLWAFEVLTRTPVPFRFADSRTELRADHPIIGVDPRGRIRELRFNNRSTGTLQLPAAETEDFYAAYRIFGELLQRPELQLDFRLGPGDCLIFDNTRLLHARTAFSAQGSRHLQGCYADLDALFSTRSVLRREPRTEPRATPEYDPLGALAALFAGEGAAEYLGEDVTQAEHMLQTAALAEAAGAPASLVAAALLHDIGHFGSLTEAQGGSDGALLMAGADNRHSHTAADWLAQWFGPDVTVPVRLHVAAKRYLCAVEPGYFDRLSDASVHTLRVQGGPMTAGEAAAFASEPHAKDAVQLRRWDEEAKDPALTPPPFAHYQGLLTGLLKPR